MTNENISTNPETLAASPESNAALHEVLTTYLASRGAEVVANNFNLLEDLPDESASDAPPPAITLCVPLAINSDEDPLRLEQTLDRIARSQQPLGKPVDVIIWANAKYSDDQQATVTGLAANNYALLRRRLSELNHTGLRVRTALQVLPEPEATMSNYRANFMDAVAVDISDRQLGYEHPVMWVDADTIDLSKEALPQIEHAVRSFNNLFVHTMTHYSPDWRDAGKTLESTDLGTRTIAVNEILRRQHVRRHIRSTGFTTGEYPEESGLAFAIGTYLALGGVDTTVPVNETRSLLAKGNNFVRKLRNYCMRNDQTPLPSDISSVLPPHLVSEYDSSLIDRYGALITYLPDVSLTMSARRQLQVLEHHGAEALRLEATQGGDGDYRLYGDYANPVSESATPGTMSPSDVARMFHEQIDRENFSDTDDQQVYVDAAHRLVERYISDTPEDNRWRQALAEQRAVSYDSLLQLRQEIWDKQGELLRRLDSMRPYAERDEQEKSLAKSINDEFSELQSRLMQLDNTLAYQRRRARGGGNS